MRVYLAALNGNKQIIDEHEECRPPYVMESMKSIDEWQIEYSRDGMFELMVDSGAYTFLTNPKDRKKAKNGEIDWGEYAAEYGRFVRKAGDAIGIFIELDLDGIVSHDRVVELREIIEEEAGRQCVPAWHPSRGKQAWLDLCGEYDYVSIGGIDDEISPKWFEYFPWFIERAHERGAKVHGLGFTRTKDDAASNYPFDSVDSSSWLWGAKYGMVWRFNGKDMDKWQPRDRRRKEAELLNRHNLREWSRYARFMESRGSSEDAAAPEA